MEKEYVIKCVATDFSDWELREANQTELVNYFGEKVIDKLLTIGSEYEWIATDRDIYYSAKIKKESKMQFFENKELVCYTNSEKIIIKPKDIVRIKIKDCEIGKGDEGSGNLEKVFVDSITIEGVVNFFSVEKGENWIDLSNEPGKYIVIGLDDIVSIKIIN